MTVPWRQRLTEEQREIVEKYQEGPIKVLAIPGSGKTHVVCALSAELWQKYPSNPNKPQIRLITFTRKAAGEAKERLVNWVGEKARYSVSTFHAIAFRIYKDTANTEMFWPKNCVPVHAPDKKMVEQLIESGGWTKDELVYEDVRDYWNTMVHDCESLEDFETSLDLAYGPEPLILADCLNIHRHRRELPLDLFCPLAVSLLRLRQKGLATFLIVDEFQDTDAAQFCLAMELVKPNRNLIVVGDLHQAIYRWRGAKPENITSVFDEFYPEVKSFPLTLNFRSVPSILDAGSKILPAFYNEEYPHRAFRPDNGLKIEAFQPPDSKEEGETLVRWVRKLMDEKGLAYSDFKVLYRNHSVSVYLERSLIEHKVPYKLLHRGQFLGKKEVQDLLAYLKWSLTPNDKTAAKRVINRPKRRIGTKTFKSLNINYNEAEKWPKMAEDLRRLLVSTHDKLQNDPLYLIDDWIYQMLYQTGLWELYQREEDRLESFLIIRDWGRFADAEQTTPLDFYTDLITSIAEDNKKKDEDDNVIQLMTIHAAKGLESKAVFVAGCVDQIIPGYRGDLQEECHLAYVSVTRAEDHLAISMPDAIVSYDGYTPTSPSRFFEPVLALPSVKILRTA